MKKRRKHASPTGRRDEAVRRRRRRNKKQSKVAFNRCDMRNSLEFHRFWLTFTRIHLWMHWVSINHTETSSLIRVFSVSAALTSNCVLVHRQLVIEKIRFGNGFSWHFCMICFPVDQSCRSLLIFMWMICLLPAHFWQFIFFGLENNAPFCSSFPLRFSFTLPFRLFGVCDC